VKQTSKVLGSAVGKLLWSAFREYSRRFWVAAVLMLVGVGLQYVFPCLTIFIVDVVLPSKDLRLLCFVILACLSLYLVVTICQSLSGLLFHYFRERVIQCLQISLFEHAQYLHLEDFEKIQNENIYSYLIKDVHNLRGLLADSLFVVGKNLLTLVVGLFLICRFNWFIASLVLSVTAFVFGTSMVSGRGIQHRTDSYHSAMGKFVSSLIRSLFNFYFIKIYSVEEFIREKIKRLQDRQFTLSYELETVRNISGGLVRFLLSLPPLLVFWYGGARIIGGTFTLGQLVGLNFVLSYVLSASQDLANTNLDIESAITSLRRLNSFLGLPSERKHENGHFAVQADAQVSFRFEHVGFSYAGQRPALRNITFSVGPGEIVALVGYNGSGKSTLLKLLLKLYDAYEGTIRLNDSDIRYVDRFDVRRMIALVPQDVIIFEGSVKENILIGSPFASDTEVIEAARNAGIHDSIQRLPSGYETQLDNERVPFSGGEKQQLALARALVKRPKILILDEATSQIDGRSEYLIKQIVREIAERNTAVLIVAHRLSTVACADKIVVLDKGRIVDIGKHWDLYQRCGHYREFSDYQLLKAPADETALA